MSGVTFEEFVRGEGRRLRAALIAAFGADLGADATADALAYGWEHWQRVGAMENPVGYLYRVGHRIGVRRRSRDGARPAFPAPAGDGPVGFEPALLPALAALSEAQRISVVLVHGYGWPIVEVADLLDVSHSTVRTHLARALQHLRTALEVTERVE